MIVFLILVGFTMKFIWPPVVKALDERAEKISHGLAAAENAKIELSNVHREVESQLAATRTESAAVLADAERRGQQIVDEAKSRATAEGQRIVTAPAPKLCNRPSKYANRCAKKSLHSRSKGLSKFFAKKSMPRSMLTCCRA